MKMAEMERSPQEQAAHFPPEVHVLDEATTEEVDNEMDSKKEDVTCSEAYVDKGTTEELENETDSKEEDVNCSTAETSQYTIIRILKLLLDF